LRTGGREGKLLLEKLQLLRLRVEKGVLTGREKPARKGGKMKNHEVFKNS